MVLIRWLLIYLVKSAVQHLNNRGQKCRDVFGIKIIIAVSRNEYSYKELELELYFYLNTVNLSDKIIIIKKLQSTLIYINMI